MVRLLPGWQSGAAPASSLRGGFGGSQNLGYLFARVVILIRIIVFWVILGFPYLAKLPFLRAAKCWGIGV